MAKCPSKNVQAEKFYGKESDIKMVQKKTAIKKSNGNSLLAKAKAL